MGEAINIEFTERKIDPEYDENTIEFGWSDVQVETRNTFPRLTRLRAYKNKVMRKIFLLKILERLLDYYSIVPKEKKK